MRVSLRFRFLLIALFLGAGVLAAQSPTGGTIQGVVTDSTGARVPAAEVVCTDSATGRVRTASTNANGKYWLSNLPVGTYSLRASHAGFRDVTHDNIQLELGSVDEVPVVLAVAAASTQINVSAETSALAPDETAAARRVDRERIEELPVESRNALDFALIEPGVTPTANSGATPSPLPSSGFTVGGLRPQSNSISIDGLDDNDEYSGAARTELSPEIVQEYQVINNGFSAANGGAAGGAVNVVSRHGENVVHGDAFVFLQNSAFDARDPFDAEAGKPTANRDRLGFALGGPLRRNRLFGYMAIEQERNRGFTDSGIAANGADAINTELAAGGLPGLRLRSLNDGFVPTAMAETEASGRIDWNLSGTTTLTSRYAFTNHRQAGDAFGSGGLSDASGDGSLFTRDNSLAISLVSTLGSSAVSDLRFQVADRHLAAGTTDLADPEIVIAGLAAFGTPYQGNFTDEERHAQLSYAYTREIGGHLLSVGANSSHVEEDVSSRAGLNGLYDFANLADFLAGTPADYRQLFAPPATQFNVNLFGVYAQDHWTPWRGWTVDAGVRYDFESLPTQIPASTGMISPRLALAWAPSARWVFRGGFGLFADRQVLANWNRVVQAGGSPGLEQVAVGLEAVQVFQANGGAGASSPTAGITPSVFRSDPNLAMPYSAQTQASAQVLLAPNLTLEATGQYVRGDHLTRTENVNLVAPVTLTTQNASALGIIAPTAQQLGQPYFGPGRLTPAFDNIYQIEGSASSNYEGLTVTLNRRMEDELEFLASYMFSRTMDNASSFGEQPPNPYLIAPEWAPSLQDQRQRLVFNALWELPIGDDDDAPSAASVPKSKGWVETWLSHFELAPILSIGSGMPVDPLVGFDANGSGAYPLTVRPIGYGRNSLRTPASADLDFRVLKYFPRGEFSHLDVVAESFNLLNHPNVTALNAVFGPGSTPAAGFSQPLLGAGARRIQFSLDYEF